MGDFKEDCNVCGVKDRTVWEVIPGVALCGTHEDQWYESGLSVATWLAKQPAQYIEDAKWSGIN